MSKKDRLRVLLQLKKVELEYYDELSNYNIELNKLKNKTRRTINKLRHKVSVYEHLENKNLTYRDT